MYSRFRLKNPLINFFSSADSGLKLYPNHRAFIDGAMLLRTQNSPSWDFDLLPSHSHVIGLEFQENGRSQLIFSL
jgi:hypothetical protein